MHTGQHTQSQSSIPLFCLFLPLCFSAFALSSLPFFFVTLPSSPSSEEVWGSVVCCIVRSLNGSDCCISDFLVTTAVCNVQRAK